MSEYIFTYEGKDVQFLVLLVEDFSQRPIFSLSHVSTHTHQLNLTNTTTAQL